MFKCPECRGTNFLEGPSGGLSVNFACVDCWARFNDVIMYISREGAVSRKERHLFRRKYVPRTSALEQS